MLKVNLDCGRSVQNACSFPGKKIFGRFVDGFAFVYINKPELGLAFRRPVWNHLQGLGMLQNLPVSLPVLSSAACCALGASAWGYLYIIDSHGVVGVVLIKPPNQ